MLAIILARESVAVIRSTASELGGRGRAHRPNPSGYQAELILECSHVTREIQMETDLASSYVKSKEVETEA